jgi:V8-like Glu-specific endopeptidase
VEAEHPHSENKAEADHSPLLNKILFWISAWWSTDRPARAKAHRPEQTHYVKLQFWKDEGSSRCHGSLIGNDLVLTAAHCVQRNWSRALALYGRDFNNAVVITRNDEEPNWFTFTKNNPPDRDSVDIAILKLPQAVTLEEGAVIASIPKQGSCRSSLGPQQAYRGIGFPANEMGVQHTTSSTGGRAAGWGAVIQVDEVVGDKGDSGSPLMSPKDEQIGVLSSRLNGKSYAVALCKYSDAIKAAAHRLSPTGSE